MTAECGRRRALLRPAAGACSYHTEELPDVVSGCAVHYGAPYPLAADRARVALDCGKACVKASRAARPACSWTFSADGSFKELVDLVEDEGTVPGGGPGHPDPGPAKFLEPMWLLYGLSNPNIAHAEFKCGRNIKKNSWS